MADNAGRWTNEEHGRFLRGLELYGKKWTKVAEVVGSRSTVQVRSHAQKYFQKMVKGGGAQEACQEEAFGRPGMPGGGIPRPYQRQRINLDSLQGKFLSVPPPLLAFVPAGTTDIASGLYTYLSPENVPSGDPSSPRMHSESHSSTDSERPFFPPSEGGLDNLTCLVPTASEGVVRGRSGGGSSLSPPPSPTLGSNLGASGLVGGGGSPVHRPRPTNEEATGEWPTQLEPTTSSSFLMQPSSLADHACHREGNTTDSAALPSSVAGGALVANQPHQHRGVPSLPAASASNNSSTVEPCHRNSVPDWFGKGRDVSSLLEQAEQLDWTADPGAAPLESDDRDGVAHPGQTASNHERQQLQLQQPPLPNADTSSSGLPFPLGSASSDHASVGNYRHGNSSGSGGGNSGGNLLSGLPPAHTSAHASAFLPPPPLSPMDARVGGSGSERGLPPTLSSLPVTTSLLLPPPDAPSTALPVASPALSSNDDLLSGLDSIGGDVGGVPPMSERSNSSSSNSNANSSSSSSSCSGSSGSSECMNRNQGELDVVVAANPAFAASCSSLVSSDAASLGGNVSAFGSYSATSSSSSSSPAPHSDARNVASSNTFLPAAAAAAAAATTDAGENSAEGGDAGGSRGGQPPPSNDNPSNNSGGGSSGGNGRNAKAQPCRDSSAVGQRGGRGGGGQASSLSSLAASASRKGTGAGGAGNSRKVSRAAKVAAVAEESRLATKRLAEVGLADADDLLGPSHAFATELEVDDTMFDEFLHGHDDHGDFEVVVDVDAADVDNGTSLD